MRFKYAPLAAAAVLAVTLAQAQDGPPAEGPAPSVKLDRVEVNSRLQSDTDLRRKSRVAKQIYGQEELERYGDSNVADVLKRLPGVDMQGGSPRMRGLGSGYTLLLINGDPAPPGFDLSQLDPAQVERIEISKGPVAEQSAQAVAGTINIILKDAPRVSQRDVRVGLRSLGGRPTEFGSFTFGERKGALSLSLPLSAFKWDQLGESTTTRDMPGTDGQPSEATQFVHAPSWGQGVNATPRLNWKISDQQALTLQGFYQQGHWFNRNDYTNSDLQGAPSLNDDALNEGTWRMLRGNVLWTDQLNDSQRVELKLGSQNVHGTFNNNTFSTVDPLRHSVGSNDDHNITSGGKLAQLIGDSHTLSLGWDFEWRRRSDTRDVTLTDPVSGVATDQLPGIDGLPFSANITRQALFAQDEWDISDHWSAYVGLRDERVVTRGEGEDGSALASNTSRVLSPLLHLNYKIDTKGKELIRGSLTRSYKAPDINSLLARPSLSSLYPDPSTGNTELAPDSYGNPSLKPELATGLDLAYEHYLAGGGMYSVGVFHREVSNLIRSVTSLETVSWSPVQRWVSQPTNFSHATASGLELEVKGGAGELMPSLFAPRSTLNLRASLNLYHSEVEALSGPNNRLDSQQPWSTTLGADYRVPKLPLNLGTNLVFTPRYTTEQTDTQSLAQSRRRGLDAFAQWSFSRTTSMRLSVNNLFASRTQADTLVAGGYNSFTQNEGFEAWGLMWESKL